MGFLDQLRRLFRGKRAPDSAYSGTFGSGSAGGFAGGSIGRLTASLATWSGAVNAELDVSLVIMRARGRQLAQNNEYGRRFLSLVAANIVGAAGPKLQVRAYMAQRDPAGAPVLDKAANDAVEIHWARWGKNADITGRMDFAHLCRVAAKSVARDGEALVRIVRQPSLRYGLALQLLEADRLDDRLNVQLTSGNVIRQGVEVDTAGRAVAYHVRTTHPGDRYATASNEIERVPASQMLHIFLPERAEQVRGYTWFHAILLRAMQLHGFNDAAVTAARIGASKIAALERPDDQGDPNGAAAMADGQVGGNLQMNVEAGEMFELPPGYKLSSWNPEYPHANFESFVKSAMRGISAGLDVATHNLSGDMTDVNFSSARIAELSERDQWMMLQAWFVRALVERVFEEWLAIALLRGDVTFEQSGKALPADKLSKFRDAARFQGRRWRWVDPVKEIDAAKSAVELGIASRTRLAAEQGDEFDDILDELSQEKTQLDDAGLSPPAAPVATPAPVPDPQENRALDDMVRLLRDAERMLVDMRAAVAARPAEPREIHIHQAEARHEIHNHVAAPDAPVVNVRNEITTPEPVVNVEAVIRNEPAPAPVVNVQVQPAEVTVVDNHPARAVQTVERDRNDEISRTVTVYEKKG